MDNDSTILLKNGTDFSRGGHRFGCWESDSVFWTGGPKGLNRCQLTAEGWKTTLFGMPEGILPEYIKDLAFDNDTLLLATDRGVIYFNTKEIIASTKVVDLALVSLKVNDSIIGLPDHLQLEGPKRNIQFNFSAISYRPGIEVDYSYRLEGLHDDWVVTQEEFANYYDLPPGDYHFKVRVRTRNGPWNNANISIPVSVIPAFYETAIFWIFLSIIVLLVALGFIFWYFQQLDARRKSSWDFSNAQLQALGLQMNPHFLFNALNSIQALAYARDHRTVNTFISRLAGLTRRVLENSNEPLILLSDELKSVREYLEMEQVRFEDRPFEWSLDIDENLSPDFKIPPMLLQPIVENAIWHGLMHKDEDRQLKVSCQKLQNGYCIEIQDNGIGFDPEHRITKGKSSVSLQNIRQRIELFNLLDYGNGSFQIGKAKSGEGTLVEFTFNFKDLKAIATQE